MRKFYYLALVALVGIAFSSCSMLGGDKEPSYRLSDLQGLWQENNTQHFVRFTTDKSDEANYLYGREWDEAEDIFEEDLKPYGNGWFKYELKYVDNQNKLTQISKMDNDGADIYERYIVTALSDKRLEYYKEGYPNEKQYYNKVTE